MKKEVRRFTVVDDDGNKYIVVEEQGTGKFVSTFDKGRVKVPGGTSWRLLSGEPVNSSVGGKTFTTMSGRKLHRVPKE